jgi:anti-sigma regulatory factor (Ser/Thr protein kinase)
MTWPLDGARPERLARRVVTDVLAALSISPGRRDDAELAIQELVVNARLYAPGPYELCVRPCEKAVTLAVTDGGGDHAAIEGRLCGDPAGAVPASAERGRGLQIVAALFPGACGAGPAERPAPGRPARAAAKQVWISVPLDG